MIGIFPNQEAITRLIGAILLQQNDEWAAQRARYMSLESIAPVSETEPDLLRLWQADRPKPACQILRRMSGSYTTWWDTI